MKKMIPFLMFLFCSSIKAQTPTLANIANFEGKVITFCEKVTGTHKSKKNVVYINFGKPYPDNECTIVIFDKDLINFSYNPVEFLKGKTICVNGKVINYKEKMEIIITKETDLIIQ